MVFVGSIWKIKSGCFLFVMSLGLSVATEVLLTCLLNPYGRVRVVGSCLLFPGTVSGHTSFADCWGPSLIFNPSFAENSPHDTTDPTKLFLAHTMVFVGSIWKSKSGWFLFVMSLGLSVATEEVLLAAGVHH
jgi:hypothetical protein